MQIKLLTFLFYSVNNFLLICFAITKTTIIFAYQITTSNEAGGGWEREIWKLTHY